MEKVKSESIFLASPQKQPRCQESPNISEASTVLDTTGIDFKLIIGRGRPSIADTEFEFMEHDQLGDNDEFFEDTLDTDLPGSASNNHLKSGSADYYRRKSFNTNKNTWISRLRNGTNPLISFFSGQLQTQNELPDVLEETGCDQTTNIQEEEQEQEQDREQDREQDQGNLQHSTCISGDIVQDIVELSSPTCKSGFVTPLITVTNDETTFPADSVGTAPSVIKNGSFGSICSYDRLIREADAGCSPPPPLPIDDETCNTEELGTWYRDTVSAFYKQPGLQRTDIYDVSLTSNAIIHRQLLFRLVFDPLFDDFDMVATRNGSSDSTNDQNSNLKVIRDLENLYGRLDMIQGMQHDHRDGQLLAPTPKHGLKAYIEARQRPSMVTGEMARLWKNSNSGRPLIHESMSSLKESSDVKPSTTLSSWRPTSIPTFFEHHGSSQATDKKLSARISKVFGSGSGGGKSSTRPDSTGSYKSLL